MFIAVSQCSSTIVLPCLSAISLDLGASIAQTQYVIINFILGAAISQLLVGPATDYFGRKKTALVCLLCFMTSSFDAVWENSITGLCWVRFMQGFSIGSASILSRAILRDLYQSHEFIKNNAVLNAILAITPVLSPLLGLCLLDLFSWRASFLFLAILSFTIGYLWLVCFEETLAKSSKPSLINYVLILRKPTFLANTFCGGLIYSAEILILNKCSLSFGFKQALLLLSCSYALGSYIAVKLSKRISFPNIVQIGLLLTVLATTTLLIFCLVGSSLQWMLILCFSIFMLGASFVYANTAALALLPFTEAAGVASCLLSVVQNGLAGIVSILMEINYSGMSSVFFTLMSLCLLAGVVFIFSKETPSHILGEGNW